MHPLTARRGKWISETIYREIENIIQHDSQKYIASEGGEDLSIQKLTNCEIDYDLFCCSDYNKSLCLEIKKKCFSLEKLYDLVKTLNMNDDNMKKCCGVSNDFIRKLTDFFFIIIGGKDSTNLTLSKMCRLKKIQN